MVEAVIISLSQTCKNNFPFLSFSKNHIHFHRSSYNFQKDVIVLRVDWGTAAMDVNYFAVVRTLPLVAKELVR